MEHFIVPYTPASFNTEAFNCPHCGTYARQTWHRVAHLTQGWATEIYLGHCTACNEATIWHDGAIVYPVSSGAPFPNPDLPDDICRDFNEARSVIGLSPRSAAALLRLAIQKLCKHLGESGIDINKDIGRLVSKGLPVSIQQALDIVRVVGNESVHPGELDMRDDRETAMKLFTLVNIIAHDRITQPREIQALYGTLPQNKLEGIAKRDDRSE